MRILSGTVYRTCAQCKVSTNPKAAVQDHREIEKLFEMISMDIGSMPTSSSGNSCFLLITDNYSKLTTAIAMPNAQGETLVNGLWRHWFSYYGLPKILQSDQGNNVDGTKIRQLCADLAIKKVRSSTYHPAGNGSAERAISFLKTLMRSMCLSRMIGISNWDQVLVVKCVCELQFANVKFANYFDPFDECEKIRLQK